MRVFDRFFAKDWERRALQHRASIAAGAGDWRYLELVRRHAAEGVNYFKALPFFVGPLLNHSEVIVELGSSFSYYPQTYSDKWAVSSAHDEGVVSTRLLLAACHFINSVAGVQATLTSIDIRESSLFENARNLLEDLGLLQYWRPVMGTDTLAWLRERQALTSKGEAALIDFALVDSNHTYDQVSGELAGLAPIMSPKAIILIDDAFTTDYRHGEKWVPEESGRGRRRGGQYGAILEFASAHPEWKMEWLPEGMVFLRRSP